MHEIILLMLVLIFIVNTYEHILNISFLSRTSSAIHLFVYIIQTPLLPILFLNPLSWIEIWFLSIYSLEYFLFNGLIFSILLSISLLIAATILYLLNDFVRSDLFLARNMLLRLFIVLYSTKAIGNCTWGWVLESTLACCTNWSYSESIVGIPYTSITCLGCSIVRLLRPFSIVTNLGPILTSLSLQIIIVALIYCWIYYH